MKALAQLKTFEAACKVEGLDPKKVLPDFSSYPKKDRKAMLAHAKLVIIARAANRLANNGKEWKPDWNNSGQYKYYPWFWMAGSSGFRFGDYALGCEFGCRLSPLLHFLRCSTVRRQEVYEAV